MVMLINKDILFLEFVDPEDAKWLFDDGKRSSRGNPMQLEWWIEVAKLARPGGLARSARN